MPRRRRQREVKKATGWIGKRQQLFTCITLFCTFLCRHCTPRLRRENANQFHFLWGTKTRDGWIFFLFLHLNMVVRNSAQKEFACIWHSKWVWVIAIEIERTQILFLSDVLSLTSKYIIRVLKKHPFTPWNAGVETRIPIHYSLLTKWGKIAFLQMSAGEIWSVTGSGLKF